MQKDSDFHLLIRPAFKKLVNVILGQRTRQHRFKLELWLNSAEQPFDRTFRLLSYAPPEVHANLEPHLPPSSQPTVWQVHILRADVLIERWTISWTPWTPSPPAGIVSSRVNPAFWSLFRAVVAMLRWLPCHSIFVQNLANPQLPDLSCLLYSSPENSPLLPPIYLNVFEPVRSFTGELRVQVEWGQIPSAPNPEIPQPAPSAQSPPATTPTTTPHSQVPRPTTHDQSQSEMPTQAAHPQTPPRDFDLTPPAVVLPVGALSEQTVSTLDGVSQIDRLFRAQDSRRCEVRSIELFSAPSRQLVQHALEEQQPELFIGDGFFDQRGDDGL